MIDVPRRIGNPALARARQYIPKRRLNDLKGVLFAHFVRCGIDGRTRKGPKTGLYGPGALTRVMRNHSWLNDLISELLFERIRSAIKM